MMKIIPTIGFGTWQITGDACRAAVEMAIDSGYRHIDTADVYGNHVEIGQAVANSGLERDELFLTTKVWRDDLDRKGIFATANRFLEELQTQYIDLLLVHWPNSHFDIQETLEAFEELKQQKIIRMIGVSNFTIPLLQEALDTGVEIVTNQVEFHPSLNQKVLNEFCNENGVIVTAYSPIGQGTDLTIPVIVELAEKYEKTPAQITLNWLISKNMVVLPRSTQPQRIVESLAASDFEMSETDLAKIENLDLHNRIVVPDFAPFED